MSGRGTPAGAGAGRAGEGMAIVEHALVREGDDGDEDLARWDLYRAVFAPQPDQATQTRAQAAFAHQARVAGGAVVHDRTYPKDGQWHGDAFVVCTGYAAQRLGTWKEVRRIRPAK